MEGSKKLLIFEKNYTNYWQGNLKILDFSDSHY